MTRIIIDDRIVNPGTDLRQSNYFPGRGWFCACQSFLGTPVLFAEEISTSPAAKQFKQVIMVSNEAPLYWTWGADNIAYGPVELPALINWIRDERVLAGSWVF